MGVQPLEFASPQPFGVYPWQAYVPPDGDPWSTSGVHYVVAPPTALSGVSLMLFIQLSQNHSINMMEHSALGAWAESPQSFYLPYMVGRSLLFQVTFHMMTKLTLNWEVGIKLSDSGVVIGYQVDEFNLTCSVQCFIASSHIYPVFTARCQC